VALEREAALERIVTVLQPYLGMTMAAASTRAHCEKLGIAPGPVSPEQIEALLAKLKGGLSVFVGREQASAIVEEIRGSLAAAKPA
jgi:hypothetical protein